jgi:hypothetical protein
MNANGIVGDMSVMAPSTQQRPRKNRRRSNTATASAHHRATSASGYGVKNIYACAAADTDADDELVDEFRALT